MFEQGEQQLIILSGISGSGKTTIATDLCNKYKNHVRINRDDLRKQLVGKLDQSYYKRKDLNSLEKQVTWLLFSQIRHLLQHDYTVIVDNTHLKESYINELLTEFQHLVEIRLVFIDTPLSECLKRVVSREVKPTLWEKIFGSKRIKNFDTNYLAKQSIDFLNLRKNYPHKMYIFPKTNSKVSNNVSFINTVICDLDGTLCLYGNKNAFERDFENDNLNDPVYTILRNWLNSNPNKIIIFFSGRNNKFRHQTEMFLTKYFETDEYLLYMREEKDQRKDSVVKAQMFHKFISDKYHVEFVIDDRKQVKRLWQKLGLFVIDVNQDDKEF